MNFEEEHTCTFCLNSGILVPGGFGKRGTEGKIAAAEWGRKMKKPYLGMIFSCAYHLMFFICSACKVVNF